jgi:hypothetical protein
MGLRLAMRVHGGARHVHLVLLDRQPCVAPSTRAAFEQLGWHVEVVPADAARWLASTPRRFSAIVANLFLHHFDDAALTSLLEAAAARTELLVACEPRRSRFALWGSRLLGALGAGAITRHDAPASVRAGFARRELSAAWPDAPGWRLGERAAGLFSHVFVAERRSV